MARISHLGKPCFCDGTWPDRYVAFEHSFAEYMQEPPSSSLKWALDNSVEGGDPGVCNSAQVT